MFLIRYAFYLYFCFLFSICLSSLLRRAVLPVCAAQEERLVVVAAAAAYKWAICMTMTVTVDPPFVCLPWLLWSAPAMWQQQQHQKFIIRARESWHCIMDAGSGQWNRETTGQWDMQGAVSSVSQRWCIYSAAEPHLPWMRRSVSACCRKIDSFG